MQRRTSHRKVAPAVLRRKIVNFLIFLQIVGFLFLGIEASFRVFLPRPKLDALLLKSNLPGYRLLASKSVDFTNGERTTPIRTNALRLRQDEEVPPIKSKEKRILFVGDSYVFGWAVKIEDSFFSLLSQKAKEEMTQEQWLFLNGGQGEFGTERMIAFVDDFGMPLEPDYIVLIMGPDDFEDNKREHDLYHWDGKNIERNPSPQSVHFVRSPIARWMPFYDWLIYHSYFLQIVRPTFVELWNSIYLEKDLKIKKASFEIPRVLKESPKITDKTVALFSYLNEKCREKNIPLWITNVGTGSSNTKILFRSMEQLKSLEIDYLDMTAVLKNDLSDLKFYTEDKHFNELGHKEFTKAFWPQLKKRLQSLK